MNELAYEEEKIAVKLGELKTNQSPYLPSSLTHFKDVDFLWFWLCGL